MSSLLILVGALYLAPVMALALMCALLRWLAPVTSGDAIETGDSVLVGSKLLGAALVWPVALELWLSRRQKSVRL